MFRNLFHIVRRFKVASTLNVLGLSLAFASFIVIMMQVEHDLTYNKKIEDSDRIYRLDLHTGAWGNMAVLNRPMAAAFKQVPEVEALTEIFPLINEEILNFTDGSQKQIKEKIVKVSPEYPKVFSFTMLKGDRDALKTPNSIFIPHSLADNYFPKNEKNTDIIGTLLKNENGEIFTIAGIYKDFPKNVSPKNIIYLGLDPEVDKNNISGQNYNVFVKLKKHQSAESILEKAVAYMDNPKLRYGLSKEDFVKNKIVVFNPIKDIYFTKDIKFDFSDKGSKTKIYLLLCIAIVILVIAMINFINFSTALAPMRIKSINTQKVLGSTNEEIRSLLISEAVLISFTGFLLSLLLLHLCGKSFISELVAADLRIAVHLKLIIAVGGISILTGLVAGIYPSFYLTSFAPAMVLKGSFGLSPKGRKLRTGLLALQFTSSIVLLCVAAFMYLQNRYMSNMDYGFDTSKVLHFEYPNIQKAKLKSLLKSNPGIEEVAFSFIKVSCDDKISRWGSKHKGEQISYECIMCLGDLPKALGLDITEGMNFSNFVSANDSKKRLFLLNETAKKEFDLIPGADFNGGKIAGFFSDFQYTTFRRSIEAMAFCLIGSGDGDAYVFSKFADECDYVYIRLAPNYSASEAIPFINKSLKEVDPYGTYLIEPYDVPIKAAYRLESNLSKMILLFSFIAIALSVIGVFGLVVFETEYKRKEIGVRKVFGSSSLEILMAYSLRYVKLIGACSIVAIPLSYYIVDRWLESFTFRVPIYWWVFALAILLVAFITLSTVTYQNYVASRANPVDSLKN